MKWLFTRRPISEFENYSLSHLDAGMGYHNRFTLLPGRTLMWHLEKIVLQEIISELNSQTILDFACGTGRISSFIEDKFPESKIYGIDISPSMLDIARSHSVRTCYKIMDSRSAILHYGEKFFDLILSFRFFANAEPALRLSIGSDLACLLSDEGTLIINNHRNFWSTSYIGRRMLGERPFGALNNEIEKIFTDQGFLIKHKISLGVWPQSDSRALLLPWKIVRSLELINLTSFAAYHRFGYNTIWVFSKKS